MPKMKTHRGAAKRFTTTGSGKLRRRKAFKGHLLEHKSSRRRRRLTGAADIHPTNERAVKRQLGL